MPAVVNFFQSSFPVTTIAVSKDQSVRKRIANQSAETQTKALASQPKPAKRQRIPVPQRIRVMQLYALGKNQTAIAKEEKLNRETVGKIVRSEEMNEFIEEMRAQFRGLSELAIAALRQQLQANGKEAIDIAWRVLETNGIVPPRGQVFNYSAQHTETTDDEAVSAAFARITLERARVFQTPFAEPTETAGRASNGVTLKTQCLSC
jgi:hypothetical protein